MLSLSRRTGESVLIGSDIVVTVHKVTGNRVRLAVSAPRSVDIVRSELMPVRETFDTTDSCDQLCESHGVDRRNPDAAPIPSKPR